VAHPALRQRGSLSDEEWSELLGATCDSKLNSFTPANYEKMVEDPNPKRIDYIFTSDATIEEAKVALTERIPSQDISYSDHFATSVTVQLPYYDPESINKRPPSYIPHEIFTSISEITSSYVIRQEKQKIYRIFHFWLGIAVCIGLLIGVWFVQEKGSIFVMMFFSTMCSWCGVLDGAIGFVWGRMELRALREFASEIDLARKVYAQNGLALEKYLSGDDGKKVVKSIDTQQT
jgi:sphingomyelin phosphodiesterase 2